MALLKQSTAYTRVFLMIDTADHITGKASASPVVNLSKAGAAFGAAAGAITELTNGWYKVALTTADTNTLGDLAYHITGTGADPSGFIDQISARIMDDAAFPATSGRSMIVDAAGLVDANAVKVGPTGAGTAQTAGDIPARLPAALVSGRIDASVGAMAANVLTAAAIAAAALNGKGDWNIGKTGYALSAAGVQAIWDALTSALTTVGSIGKLLVDNVNASISAVKTKTDQLTFTIANKVDSSLQAAGDLATAVGSKIADIVLRRTYANARASSDGDAVNFRSLLGAVGKLVNKWSISGATLTVFQEDDVTSTAPGGTQAVTGTPGADPITTLDTN